MKNLVKKSNLLDHINCEWHLWSPCPMCCATLPYILLCNTNRVDCQGNPTAWIHAPVAAINSLTRSACESADHLNLQKTQIWSDLLTSPSVHPPCESVNWRRLSAMSCAFLDQMDLCTFFHTFPAFGAIPLCEKLSALSIVSCEQDVTDRSLLEGWHARFLNAFGSNVDARSSCSWRRGAAAPLEAGFCCLIVTGPCVARSSWTCVKDGSSRIRWFFFTSAALKRKKRKNYHRKSLVSALIFSFLSQLMSCLLLLRTDLSAQNRFCSRNEKSFSKQNSRYFPKQVKVYITNVTVLCRKKKHSR